MIIYIKKNFVNKSIFWKKYYYLIITTDGYYNVLIVLQMEITVIFEMRSPGQSVS